MKARSEVLLVSAVVAVIAAGPAFPQETKAGCTSAAFPADHVCDARATRKKLPPPHRHDKHSVDDSPGLTVGKGVSLDAKTNFNDNRYGEAPLKKFNPRPRGKEDVNAGPQLNFKF